jgi:hypothetical protein
MYSIAKPSANKPMILTHSSYWLEKNQPQQNEKLKAEERKSDTSTSSDKSQGDAGKDSGPKTEVVEVRVQLFMRNMFLMYSIF